MCQTYQLTHLSYGYAVNSAAWVLQLTCEAVLQQWLLHHPAHNFPSVRRLLHFEVVQLRPHSSVGGIHSDVCESVVGGQGFWDVLGFRFQDGFVPQPHHHHNHNNNSSKIHDGNLLFGTMFCQRFQKYNASTEHIVSIVCGSTLHMQTQIDMQNKCKARENAAGSEKSKPI